MRVKITLFNWKCYPEKEVPIDGMMVYIMPNGSGKTAILDGIEFALTGDVQSARQRSAGLRGKDHLGSFIRHGFDKAMVRLEIIETKSFIERTLTRGSDGSIKEVVTAYPDSGEKSSTGKERAFLAAINPNLMLLRFREFVNLKVVERRKFIESMMPMQSETEIKARLLRELPEEALYLADEWYSGMPFTTAADRMLDRIAKDLSACRAERIGHQKHMNMVVEFNHTGTSESLDKEIADLEMLVGDLKTRLGTAREKASMLERFTRELELIKTETDDELEPLSVRALTDIELDIERAKEEYASYQAKAAELNNAVQHMKRAQLDKETWKSGNCPTCGQPCENLRLNTDKTYELAVEDYKKAADECPADPSPKLRTLEDEYRTAKVMMQKYSEEVQARDSRKATREARRLTMEKQLNEIGQIENVEELEERIEGLIGKLGKLRSKKLDFEEEKAQDELRKRSQAKIDETIAKEETLNTFKEAIMTVRTYVLKRAIEKVNERINEVLHVLSGEQFKMQVELTDERGADKCDIAMIVGGKRVDFESVSDSQQYFSLAALAIASADIGLKVALFDGLEVFDAANIAKFTAGLQTLVERKRVDVVVGSYAAIPKGGK